LNHFCNWAPFVADAPPAASADDAVRRSLRCECRSDLVSQRFDQRDRQPGRLVFGLRPIAATDTSNPNHKLHTRQHQLPIPQAQRATVDGLRLPQYGLKERSCLRRW
jgi:hypothetical protein